MWLARAFTAGVLLLLDSAGLECGPVTYKQTSFTIHEHPQVGQLQAPLQALDRKLWVQVSAAPLTSCLTPSRTSPSTPSPSFLIRK